MTRKMSQALLAAGVLATALAATFAAAPAMAQSVMPKLLKKVAPEFPGEAVRKGVYQGVLKVKVNVDGGGAVTGTEVVSVNPAKARMLNDAVVGAVSQWKFEGSGHPAEFEVQVVLTAE